jgi:hypothetical protein
VKTVSCILIFLSLCSFSARAQYLPRTATDFSVWNESPNLDFEVSLGKDTSGNDIVNWKIINLTSTSTHAQAGTMRVITYPSGTSVYTWAKPEQVNAWVNQPAKLSQDLDYFMQKGKGANGGGFYASLDSVDSIQYGESLASFKTPQAIKLVNFNDFVIAAGSLKDVPDSETPFSNRLNLKLKELGFDGSLVESHTRANTWIDFFRTEALGAPKIGTLEDVISGAHHVLNLPELLMLDARVGGLRNIPELEKISPEAHQIFKGIALTDQEWTSWFNNHFNSLEDFSEHLITSDRSLETSVNTPFCKKLLRSEKNRFEQMIRSELGTDSASFHAYLPDMIPHFARTHLYQFISATGFRTVLSEKAPFQFPVNDFTKITLPEENNLNQSNPGAFDFEQKIELSLNYIDFPDLVADVSNGAVTPWHRYDTSGTTDLNDLFQEGLTENLLPGNSGLLRLHEILSTDTSGFRDHDVLAGGDLYPDARSGYYRVTAMEKERILSNPFLNAEFYPDPDSTKTFLGRHEYASPKHFRKFQTLLSAELQKNLVDADTRGIFTQPDSPEYKSLVQKVISELVAWSLNMDAHADGEASTMYQQLMSIHPFGDFNGRSLRLYYQKITGMPLFLTDWNNDLFLSPPEFHYAIAVGTRKYQLMKTALRHELNAHPNFPHFYDLAEWFVVEGDLQKMPKDLNEFVQMHKAFYSDPNTMNLIRQKRFSEVGMSCDLKLQGGNRAP